MSNKRYRRPANPGYVSPALANPQTPTQPAPAGRPGEATQRPAVEPPANPVIQKVSDFLGDLMARVTRALDQAEALPVDDKSWHRGLAETRLKLIMALTRIGIAATKTLMQSMRAAGTLSRTDEFLLKEAAAKLEGKLQDLRAPAETPSARAA